MDQADTAVAMEAITAATTTTATEPSDRLFTQAVIRPATVHTPGHTTITTHQPWFLTETTTTINQVTMTCTTVDTVVVIIDPVSAAVSWPDTQKANHFDV